MIIGIISIVRGLNQFFLSFWLVWPQALVDDFLMFFDLATLGAFFAGLAFLIAAAFLALGADFEVADFLAGFAFAAPAFAFPLFWFFFLPAATFLACFFFLSAFAFCVFLLPFGLAAAFDFFWLFAFAAFAALAALALSALAALAALALAALAAFFAFWATSRAALREVAFAFAAFFFSESLALAARFAAATFSYF